MKSLIARVMLRYLYRWATRMENPPERFPADEWESGYLRARQDVCSMLGVNEKKWP